MTRYRSLILLLALGLPTVGCAAEAADSPPCGVIACGGVDQEDVIPEWDGQGEADVGKFDREGVESAIAISTGDGVFDGDDVRDAFDAAGDRVGNGEMRAIRLALRDTSYEVTADAYEIANDLAYVANLFDYETESLEEGISYGDTEIPPAVRELVARARLHGAIAYDVQEIKESTGEPVWNPYLSTTPPVGNMTFDYTEVTPEALAADIADVDAVYDRITGTETEQWCDGSGNCQDYQQVTYAQGVGGTGNVLSQYDEAYHPNIYARGSQGQRWANNCAILSDGSVHCLPASRRSELQDLILTNPHLSRCNSHAGFEEGCRHLLYHGHIDIRDGVVTGVEMSGRISKRAAKGQAIFIDPIAVLEAWGFEMRPGLSIRFGNTSEGTPIRDTEGGVVREAD
ncbi:MAG: hypothetical protein AB8H86_32795 [Polyangiales bacterium]